MLFISQILSILAVFAFAIFCFSIPALLDKISDMRYDAAEIKKQKEQVLKNTDVLNSLQKSIDKPDLSFYAMQDLMRRLNEYQSTIHCLEVTLGCEGDSYGEYNPRYNILIQDEIFLDYNHLRFEEYSERGRIFFQITLDQQDKNAYRAIVAELEQDLLEETKRLKGRCIELAANGDEKSFKELGVTETRTRALDRLNYRIAKEGVDMKNFFRRVYKTSLSYDRKAYQSFWSLVSTIYEKENNKIEELKQQILLKLQEHAHSLTREPKLLDSSRGAGQGHIMQNVQTRLVPPEGC